MTNDSAKVLNTMHALKFFHCLFYASLQLKFWIYCLDLMVIFLICQFQTIFVVGFQWTRSNRFMKLLLDSFT